MELKMPSNNIIGFLLLVMVIVVEFHVSSQQFFGPLDAYPKENSEGFALTNSSYKTFTTTSYGTCLLACEADMNCLSLNFLMTTSTCDLNIFSKESSPAFFTPRHNSIYTSPLGRHPMKKKVGGMENPAKSCLEILKTGAFSGSGKYWLRLEGTSDPMQAYCDMTTDGGGWTVVRRLVQPNNVALSASTVHTYDVIKQYDRADVNVIPMGAAMLDIKNKMGFHQIHFYCRKVNVGRVVSIMTKNNTAGQAVVNYFTSPGTASRPTACGSFDILPDDTSNLSQNCNRWGVSLENKWGASCCVGPMRIVAMVAHIGSTNGFEFGMYFSCDNTVPSGASNAVPPDAGDTWQISVR